MLPRHAYIDFLEKRATSEEDVLHESIPSNNSSETADTEHTKNQEDHRSYLHSLFTTASEVQNNQSSELKKLFPELPSNTITSNPLMKVASRQVFFNVIQTHGNFLKVASPLHIEIACNAFQDELEKIALSFGSSSLTKALPGQMGIGQSSRLGAVGSALHTTQNMGQTGNALHMNGPSRSMMSAPQPQMLR